MVFSLHGVDGQMMYKAVVAMDCSGYSDIVEAR